jgi:hypothetical protein
MSNQKLQKLVAWAGEIKLSCQNLRVKSYYYKEYLKIIQSNKEIASPSDFYEWIARNYYESALMNIRRLVDKHRGVISLHNLVMELHNEPGLITKEWYLEDVEKHRNDEPPTTYDYGEQHFVDTYTDDGESLSVRKIEEDLAEIYKLRLRVEGYIDNCLAHHNQGKKGKQQIKTELVEEVIGEVEKLVIKYVDLFRLGSFETLLPVYQYDWQEVFYKPWIKT